MTSVIKVDDIKTSTGSTTVLDTNQEFDTWRLASDWTTNSARITGWERPDGGTADACPLPIGTGLSEDNGVWSFGRTGFYRIDAAIRFQSNILGNLLRVKVQVSKDNGSNFADYIHVDFGTGEADIHRETSPIRFFLNVGSISGSNAVKFGFFVENLDSGEEVQGHTDINYTWFTSQRLAPVQ